MTIEELKEGWEDSRSPGPDCSDSEFAQKYMDKLLAVAEAAQPLSIKTSFNKDSWTQVDELNEKLKDLLGE